MAPFAPVRVIAGPGSGKTRVLVGRILHIVDGNPNEAGNILAVSFTNKAAEEMKKRVSEKLSGSVASKIFFATFHSFCYRMLKAYGTFEHEDWIVMDQEGSQHLMEHLVREHLPSMDRKEVHLLSRSLLSEIKKIKNTIGYIDPNSLESTVKGFCGDASPDVLQDHLMWTKIYEDSLRKNNAIDFDDLIGLCLHMLEKDGQVRKQLQKRFQHVLVDEFQDVNQVQYKLLRQLCPPPTPHLFVVGDIDQAIYSWRGSSAVLMQSVFQRDYEDSLTFRLKDNYRTTKPILDSAQRLINLVENNERGILNAVRKGEGRKILVNQYKDPIQEGQCIAEDIQRRLAENREERVAILLRTRSQARCIESALAALCIPYSTIGGVSFWKRSEIRDILAYLKLALNPCDQASFDRVINTPKRGIGPSALKKIQAYADSVGLSLSQVVLRKVDNQVLLLQKNANLTSKVGSELQNFRRIIFDIKACLADMPLAEIIDRIIHLSAYREFIETNNKEDESKKSSRLETLDQLLEQAKVFSGALSSKENDVIVSQLFVDHAAINDGDDDVGSVSNLNSPVVVSTMHAAKGLEFDHVYVPGLNDGLVPLSPSREKTVDAWSHMEEETRLLFVAVTRAKNSLVLSYTQEPASYPHSGKRHARRPQLKKSRFLSCFEESTYT